MSEKPVSNRAHVVQPASLTFMDFAKLGYTLLVPIVPPDAPISDKSSLLKRPGARGKAVGVKGHNGWHGFDWINYEATDADLERWQAMGAGIGIKTGLQPDGTYLVLIDADTLNEEWARIIRDVIEQKLGKLAVRIGRYPKAGYVVRLSEPMQYTRIEFGEVDEKGRLKDRVEILSDGRQFVAHGIHPATGKPYTWPRGVPQFSDIPVLHPDQIREVLEALRFMLPNGKPLVTEGSKSSAVVDQDTLKGDVDRVREAVSLIPNSYEAREDYISIGVAIKAATQDDEAAGLEIYQDWCARWDSGDNDPDVVEADWRRFKPPYRRGANWLYELAEQHAPDKFNRASTFFDILPDEEPSPLYVQHSAGTAEADVPVRIEPTPYAFPEPANIPPRQWLYGDHYVRGVVSATVAPGGLGKSSLTIVEALAIASGKPLLGIEPIGVHRVWLWNGEDPREELNRRIAAAMQYYGLTRADVADRLLVDTGMEQEIVLARQSRNGAAIIEPVAAALAGAIERNAVDLFVVDPLVSSHKVTENDNAAIDLVVKRWGKLAFATNTAIDLVHHARKTNGAEVTVEDARGASALVNGARSVRALTRMTGAEGGRLGIAEPSRYFRSGGIPKNNLAPALAPAAKETTWFTLVSEPLGNGSGVGLGTLMDGDRVGVVTRAELSDMTQSHNSDRLAEALQIIRQGEWREDVRAGDAWVGHAVAEALGLDGADKTDRAEINAVLRQLRSQGLIRTVSRKDQSRHQRRFVEAVETNSAPVVAENAGGVFA